MSDTSKKKVSFRDTGNKVETRETGKSSSSKTRVSIQPTYCSSGGSVYSGKSISSNKSSSSYSSSNIHSQRVVKNKKITKLLVRNCDAPIGKVVVMKPHEMTKTKHQDTNEKATKELDHALPQLPAEPKPHTLLKTAREIRRISDIDIEEAYESLEGLTLIDDKIRPKVANTALNMHPDERIYKDLVSVDVAESQLGPRITEVRKHKVREKHDPEPCLQDFVRSDSSLQDDYRPSFSSINIPFCPVPMYNGKRVTERVRKWTKSTQQLLSFNKHKS